VAEFLTGMPHVRKT